MRSASKIFGVALAFAGFAAAQPSVNVGGVVSPASYALAGSPNGSIARGSMVAIFGSKLGPAALAQATTYPLPSAEGLKGVTVSVTSGAVTAFAILNYVSAGQVGAIIPSSIPAGNATLTVTYNSQTSAPAAFKIVESNFGAFTSNAGGTGPGIVANGSSVVYTPTNSAHPGDTVAIWGVGLGATTGNEAQAPVQVDMPSIPVEIFVNNIKANIAYRGRSGNAGVDQINFVVPATTGCGATVIVKINSVVSNNVTMPIASTGTKVCTDPGGPSAADLQKFDAQGGASIGGVALSRVSFNLDLSQYGLGIVAQNADGGSATFYRYSTAQLNATDNPFKAITVGSCTIQYSLGGNTAASPIVPVSLDAGAQINISPSGKAIGRTTFTVGSTNSYTYATPIDPTDTSGTGFLAPGTYTVTGSGGANVGAFSASAVLGGPVTSNVSSISSVTRASGLTFTWSGVPASSTVLLFANSSTDGSSATSIAGTVYCTAKASDGTFTIPAQVMLSLPPSAIIQGIATGSIGIGSYGTPTIFAASGLDYGVFSTSTMAFKNLNIQ